MLALIRRLLVGPDYCLILQSGAGWGKTWAVGKGELGRRKKKREELLSPSTVPGVELHLGPQEPKYLGLIPHQLHSLRGAWGALVHGSGPLGRGQQLTGGHLPVELSLGQGDNFKVREPGLEDPGGKLQPLQDVSKEKPVAGPAKGKDGS